jgi:hypothetical protein
MAMQAMAAVRTAWRKSFNAADTLLRLETQNARPRFVVDEKR